MKPRVLMSALLHMTMETDETTERLNAPIVPSWNLLASLIFTLHYLNTSLESSTQLSSSQIQLRCKHNSISNSFTKKTKAAIPNPRSAPLHQQSEIWSAQCLCYIQIQKIIHLQTKKSVPGWEADWNWWSKVVSESRSICSPTKTCEEQNWK